MLSKPITNFLDLNKYEIKGLIGEGSFSKVYKVIEKETGKTYAAKISKNRLEDIGSDLITNLRREISIMMQLNYPSIISFIGYSPINFNHKAKPVIVTEFLSNGSLNDIIKLERQGLSPKNWNDTKKLINIFGIASAMSYLHSKNILHRDLKPANILEDDSFYPKVSDFGISKKQHFNQQSIKQSIQSVKGIKGTPAFLAPESFENYEYIKAGDVYAFSIVVYELMSLVQPYSNIPSNYLAFKIVNDYRPDLKYVTDECYRDLISRCWSKDPKERPTFDQIIFELKNNRNFILDGMDKDEYYDYIESIDKSDNSFLFNNNDDNEEPNKQTNTKLLSGYSVKVCESNKLSPIFIKLTKKKRFNKIPSECQEFFKRAHFIQDKKKSIIIIQSDEINNLLLNNYYELDYFIKSLNFFDEVVIEIESKIETNDHIFLCISKWLSKSVNINVSIFNVESIINLLRNEKLPFNLILQSSFKSIDVGLFSDFSSISQVTIPSSVTEICAYAFSECSSLTRVLIPSSVTEIGVGAFRMCALLNEISFPSSVTQISDFTFFQCISLNKITIPSSINKIGSHAFSGCSSLNKIKLPPSLIEMGSNVFEGCSSLKKISLPSSMKEIGDHSFSKCISLINIKIPDSINKIGSHAFFNCSSLAQILIPPFVNEIGCDAFNGCSLLEKIIIPAPVTIIKSHTFDKCLSLKQISLPSLLKEIENNSFYGCSSLTQISIPSTVTKIGSNAFSGCSLLVSINIPSSVNIIESNTFNKCSSLNEITLPSSLTRICWGAFNECKSLAKISIPSSVTEIDHYAFNGCSLLEGISIPPSVVKIENNTFSKCTSLRKISFPNSLNKIGNNAFYGCSLLKEISIPSSVNFIGKNAFGECPFISLNLNLPPKIILNDDEDIFSVGSYEYVGMLGRGAFGKVMLVRCKADNKLYAMKSISKKLIQDTNNIQATKNERDVLFNVHHPFIVSAHCCFQTNTHIFIILDYIESELFSRLKEEEKFTESRTRLYAAEIALAIEYFHDLGYIYRDLKPENILIDSDGYIKITDLGFVRKDIDSIMTFCGTPEYISPEMILRQPYNKSVDWWSFGILVYEMLTGMPPFYDCNTRKLYQIIIESDINFPPYISPVAKQFISQLLEKDPSRRLGSSENGFKDIRNHPFFQGLNWNDLLNKRIIPEWIPDKKNICYEPPTNNNISVTYVDPASINNATQKQFIGFTYNNEEKL